MKNVIVFALGQTRYAVELRWVREVFTLGPVTPVAHAPDAVAGVVNYRGAIVPILDLDVLLGRAAAQHSPVRSGEGAILIEVEEVRAALRVTSVVEVSSLRPEAGGEVLLDSSGRPVPLVEPPALVARARSLAESAAHAADATPAGGRGA